MPEDIGLFDAMYSQRAVRYFSNQPVPDEVVERLLEAASKAPSGANRQPWRFLVIRDPETRKVIADYYLKAWTAAYGETDTPKGQLARSVRTSADYMANHLADVPVLVLACIEHDGSASTMSRGGSIYPAVQNFLLAARALGLGSVLTSLHKRYEDEIKSLLSIPENVETATLLPLGYPAEGQSYGSTRRAPVSEITYWEKWGAHA